MLKCYFSKNLLSFIILTSVILLPNPIFATPKKLLFVKFIALIKYNRNGNLHKINILYCLNVTRNPSKFIKYFVKQKMNGNMKRIHSIHSVVTNVNES
jgi:hypothetical protein